MSKRGIRDGANLTPKSNIAPRNDKDYLSKLLFKQKDDEVVDKTVEDIVREIKTNQVVKSEKGIIDLINVALSSNEDKEKKKTVILGNWIK